MTTFTRSPREYWSHRLLPAIFLIPAGIGGIVLTITSVTNELGSIIVMLCLTVLGLVFIGFGVLGLTIPIVTHITITTEKIGIAFNHGTPVFITRNGNERASVVVGHRTSNCLLHYHIGKSQEHMGVGFGYRDDNGKVLHGHAFADALNNAFSLT